MLIRSIFLVLCLTFSVNLPAFAADTAAPSSAPAPTSDTGKGTSTNESNKKPGAAPVQLDAWESFGLLFIYVAIIAALPLAATMYDTYKSYVERKVIIDKLPHNTSAADLRQFLKDLDSGPTGFTGLTRGIVALTLLLILAVAIFHLVVFQPTVSDLADRLLILLAGTLTSITGFYFGSKATAEAQSKRERANTKNPAPVIMAITPNPAAAGSTVTLTGHGFGNESGTVMFGQGAAGVVINNGWKDTEIKVTVPSGLTGTVPVVVKTKTGSSSDPYQFNVS